MTCEVEAHPPPHFKWFFNGVELSDNETFKIFSDDSVSHLQVGLDYCCLSWLSVCRCLTKDFELF